eukprot:6175155-Pleurochrysis_carterae.AAC.2
MCPVRGRMYGYGTIGLVPDAPELYSQTKNDTYTGSKIGSLCLRNILEMPAICTQNSYTETCNMRPGWEPSSRLALSTP